MNVFLIFSFGLHLDSIFGCIPGCVPSRGEEGLEVLSVKKVCSSILKK